MRGTDFSSQPSGKPDAPSPAEEARCDEQKGREEEKDIRAKDQRLEQQDGDVHGSATTDDGG